MRPLRSPAPPQGLARRMLGACEALAARRCVPSLYLHARLGDEPALALYQTSGYVPVDQDSWLIRLQGRTPRALMRKELSPTRL